MGNIISSLGGDVFKNSFTGRPFHVNTKAFIGNSLLTFDSFDTLLDVDTKNKDINTVKVLGNYYGVSCDLNDKNIRYEWVNEVYRDEENCGLDIIMSIKQDNGSMVYFLFGDNYSLDIYSKEEIEEMFLNNQLIKIDKGYFVPGIDRSIQEESTRVAGSEIVPKVLEKVYQDSLG